MIILRTNLKRVFLDKSNFLFLFIIPIIFSMFLLEGNNEASKSDIAVYSENKDEISDALIKSLNKDFNVVETKKESDIQKNLLKDNVSICLKLKDGFGEALLKGDISKIEVIQLKGQRYLKLLNKKVEYIFNNYAAIGIESNGNKNIMIHKLEEAQKELFCENIENISFGKGTQYHTATAMGLIALSIMSICGFGFIIEDKEEKRFTRFMTTPMDIKSYHIQNLLTYFSITAISTVILLLFQIEHLGVNIKGSVVNLVIVFLLLGLVCTAECIFVSSISKNSRQFSVIQSFIYTPSILLGGCYFPRSMMPKLLQNISNIIPTTWALKATDKVVYGGGLSNIYMELGILVLFAIVFFLLSSWKKSDLVM